jgi:hypothetical protein
MNHDKSLHAAAENLNEIVEGVTSVRWSGGGVRLKDTIEWAEFYCALKRAGKHQPLQVSIDGERLVVSIGISTLAFADAEYQRNDQNTIKISPVTDELGFAKDIARELERENEIGETMLTDLLDKATTAARDRGSIHVEYENL